MFRRMLVPLDGSDLAECVLPHVRALAHALDAHVTLLRVLDYPAEFNELVPIDLHAWELYKAGAEAYIDDIGARLRPADLDVESVVMEGRPASTIIDYARTHDIDLIVLSSHGAGGLSGWNVSSTVQKVILRSRLSCLTVRAYQAQPDDQGVVDYRRVLIPLDGSPRAEHALAVAVSVAQNFHARLVLAHVVRQPESPCHKPLSPEDESLAERLTERNRQEAVAYLDHLRQEWSGDGEMVARILVGDDPAYELHRLIAQEQVDLVVMSAHGCSGKTRWPYGSVASNFITYGANPLLIVQDLPPDQVELTAAELAAMEHQGH